MQWANAVAVDRGEATRGWLLGSALRHPPTSPRGPGRRVVIAGSHTRAPATPPPAPPSREAPRPIHVRPLSGPTQGGSPRGRHVRRLLLVPVPVVRVRQHRAAGACPPRSLTHTSAGVFAASAHAQVHFAAVHPHPILPTRMAPPPVGARGQRARKRPAGVPGSAWHFTALATTQTPSDYYLNPATLPHMLTCWCVCVCVCVCA